MITAAIQHNIIVITEPYSGVFDPDPSVSVVIDPSSSVVVDPDPSVAQISVCSCGTSTVMG